ncbi:hypothetical protein HPP92_024818 [Vanilla planifolia]|uniref:LOB domain-containing protein n=1 Tax=Vanilla planifolia TaxID=51239 RepID=A0A835PHX7_VANPL|nr:hypothetical protein HPP92_025083 [Vanilla planifolia]KAG0453514.1 hypothetical protein HPP92_024818 [Vanilla planifolia]
MNSDNTNTSSSSSTSHSPTSSPSSTPSPPTILVPCAACKLLRRRCGDKCVLAPYFPPNEPLKFTIAHRVFGASNIIKSLQELSESQRADAVSSMVYEANARIRDPVYGSAGVVCRLQKQVAELQAHLARTQADLLHVKTHQANLLALFSLDIASSSSFTPQLAIAPSASPGFILDDDCGGLGSIWEEQLWTC